MDELEPGAWTRVYRLRSLDCLIMDRALAVHDLDRDEFVRLTARRRAIHDEARRLGAPMLREVFLGLKTVALPNTPNVVRCRVHAVMAEFETMTWEELSGAIRLMLHRDSWALESADYAVQCAAVQHSRVEALNNIPRNRAVKAELFSDVLPPDVLEPLRAELFALRAFRERRRRG